MSHDTEDVVRTIHAGSCCPSLCYCCGDYHGPDAGVCSKCGDSTGYRWYCRQCKVSHPLMQQGVRLAMHHAGINDAPTPGMIIVAAACPSCGNGATTFDYTVVRLLDPTVN